MRQFKSALTSPLLLALSVCLTAGSPTASAKTTINIINGDSAGEGFNDTTAVDPIGGNTGTTVGEMPDFDGEKKRRAFKRVIKAGILSYWIPLD